MCHFQVKYGIKFMAASHENLDSAGKVNKTP